MAARSPIRRSRWPRAVALVALVALVTASAVTSAPRTAAAEPPVGNKVAADALYEDAKRLLNEQRFQEALEKLLASQRLDPAIGTLLNIAFCYEKLGKTASAWSTYNEVVGLANSSGDKQGRGERARQAAQALEPRLARVVVAVPAESRVDGLVIRRDGEAIDAGTWGSAIPIDPGPHAFAASAPGRAPWSVSADVAAAPGTITVTVPPLATGIAWGPQRIAGVAVAGVGVAGVIVGGVFGILTIVKKNAETSHCEKSDPHLCDATGVDLRAQALTTANASNVAFAVGGAALAAGAAVFFTAPHGGGGSASVRIGPVVGAQVQGVSITGRW